ncbi:hypothetical protein GCM10025777_21990 [Membranihabitans marinus]
MDDTNFRSWIRHNTANEDWLNFLASHPQQKREVDTARQLLQELYGKYKADELPANLIELEWVKFKLKAEGEKKYPKQAARKISSIYSSLAIAASLLVLVGLGFWLFQSEDGPQSFMEYHTQAGQIEKINLPDSTQVVLNANSSLILPQSFSSDKPRRVQLIGEGHFDVTPAVNAQNAFVVEMNKSSIQVLGTKFNAKNSTNIVAVALEEGNVRFHYLNALNKMDEVDIRPGEYLSLDNQRRISTENIDDIEQFGRWTDGYFIYDKTEVDQILKDIENQFSVEFTSMPKDLKNRKVNGVVSATSLSEALEVIQILLDVETTLAQDSSIVINYRKN